MKNNTLIYIFYIFSILIITIFLSIQILGGKTTISPTGSLFEIKNLSNSQIINSVKTYNEIRKTFDRRENSLGFHDVEWMTEKPANIFRIIALGDSMTHAEAVPLELTWSKQLETKLNDLNFTQKFEVFNMGMGGDGTFQEVERFKNIGLNYTPDMVILQYYPRDWESPEVRITATELFDKYKKGEIELPIELPIELKEIMKETNATESDISAVIHTYTESKYFENKTPVWEEEWDKWTKTSLTELIKICQEKNIKLIIIGWDFQSNTYLQEKEKLISLLQIYNITFYDFSEYLPPPNPNLCPSDTRIPDCHLNALGYEIVANKILETLISQQLLIK